MVQMITGRWTGCLETPRVAVTMLTLVSHTLLVYVGAPPSDTEHYINAISFIDTLIGSQTVATSRVKNILSICYSPAR